MFSLSCLTEQTVHTAYSVVCPDSKYIETILCSPGLCLSKCQILISTALASFFFSSTLIWVENVITKLVRNMPEIDSE